MQFSHAESRHTRNFGRLESEKTSGLLSWTKRYTNLAVFCTNSSDSSKEACHWIVCISVSK